MPPPELLAASAAAASDAASGPPAAQSATDPGLLPQTHDVPQASGAAFAARVAALWKAIVIDDPDAAMPFFFPLAAYEQVKDVGNPAGDWKHRLVAAYAHDIHALHARLPGGGGKEYAGPQFVAFDVPEAQARWVEPGEEYNRIGYFRVFGSKLRYRSEGTEQTFDVKSLISWRGQWYVVHLSAIK